VEGFFISILMKITLSFGRACPELVEGLRMTKENILT